MRVRICRLIVATFGLLPAALLAAPKLRLAVTSLGPLNIAIGSDGPAQSVAIQNAGDGTLHLTAYASAPWLAASISNDHVQIALATASLAKGIYTATLTLSDPAAIDAPQNITVTVQIGGGVPDQVDLALPPGGSASRRFVSDCAATRSVVPPVNGPSLSLAISGNGSFSFTCTYTVSAQSPAATSQGDYNGSFTLGGSTFAGDNKTVPVAIHVTSQPIAEPVPAQLTFHIAQGAAPQSAFVTLANLGLGNLSIQDVSTGVPGIHVQISGEAVEVTADASGMPPEDISGAITVETNAFGGAVKIPVELEVLPPGPPLIAFGGIVDNAIFAAGDPLPPGGIAALFGDQLTAAAPEPAANLPLPNTLAGARVWVNGQPAALYYVSPTQITFQVPFETAPGEAFVSVERDGRSGNTVSLTVAERSPRILVLPFGNYAVAVNAADQSLVIPAMPGLNAHPAKAGDTIVIYAIGLGATDPPVPSGAAPAGLARVTTTPQVYFNRGIFTNYVAVEPLFAGLTPGFAGLYQLNVVVPADAPKGDQIPIYILFPGFESNHANVAIQ